jgi:hypothetical protein
MQRPNPNIEGPENTAERTALWRALHVAADAPPHIIDDTIGLKLLAPEGDWRARPDMDVQGTRIFRASIVARASTVSRNAERRSPRASPFSKSTCRDRKPGNADALPKPVTVFPAG